MSPPRIYVCGEKGCGKGRQRRALRDELRPVAEVVVVGCQSVCDGPVAGIVQAGRLRWFERVSTGKARAALTQVADDGDAPLRRPLRKRLVRKRTGKLRG